MSEQHPNLELDQLRKWIHELNNRLAVILGMSELLSIEQLPPRSEGRRKSIEEQALAAKEILKSMSDHYFD